MPSALAPLQLMSVAKSIPVLGYLLSWAGILEDWEQKNDGKSSFLSSVKFTYWVNNGLMLTINDNDDD